MSGVYAGWRGGGSGERSGAASCPGLDAAAVCRLEAEENQRSHRRWCLRATRFTRRLLVDMMVLLSGRLKGLFNFF